MTTRITFILFFFTWHLPGLNAQPPIPSINIQLIGPEQGLPDRNTRSVIQDPLGFLWLGTRTGLYRYDGYNFKIYNHLLLQKNTERYTVINDVRLDNKGRLWVAHENGLAIIDPVSLSSQKIDLTKYFPREIFLPATVRIYFDIDNNAWVTWKVGLVKFSSNISPLFVYRCHNPVNSGTSLDISLFHDDRKGNLYLYSGGNNLEVITNTGIFKTLLPLPFVEIKKIKYCTQYVFGKTDSSLTLVGTSPASTKSISAEFNLNTRCIDNAKKNFLPVFLPAYIFPDKQGNLWYNNFNEIGYVNRHTGEYYNVAGVLKNKAGENLTFFSQTISKDNTLWFCTGSGLLKIYLSPSLFDVYLNLPLKNADDVGVSIRGITEDEDANILVCSYAYLDAGEIYTFHMLNTRKNIILNRPLRTGNAGKIASPLMKSITMGEDIYAITDGTQLLKINRKTFRTEIIDFYSATGSNFTNMTAVNDSVLWLATLNGMAAFNSLSRETIIFNNQAGSRYIKNVRVNFFLKASENMYWVCTLKGIYLLDQNGKIVNHYGNESSCDIQLPIANVSHLCFNKSKLWATTLGGGLLCIDTASKKIKQFTTESGLPDNVVYAVLPDDAGCLWLSTNNGLCRLNIANETVHNYGSLDGLPHHEFNSFSFLKARNGKLYFGSLNGFVSFDPSKIDTSQQPQALLQLVAFSKYAEGKDSMIIFNGSQLSKRIEINPGDRLFSFAFMTADYRNTAQNKFRYKLEGWNAEGWQAFESGNRLLFNSLPPGKYTLRVQVAVAGSNWNKDEWAALIMVNKPWYNEWWFYALSLATVAGLVYIFYRYRIKELIRIQNIRNRISADMHDEIGSTLSSISFYSQALLIQTRDENQKPVLEKIKENAQQVQEGLSDIVWSVKASMDEMENVFSRMQRFGAELLDSKNVLFHFEVDEKMNHTKLEMADRKNFYLIFKEALNNAAKYAQCKNVWVTIGKGGGNATMIIKDDGKGFNNSKQSTGNGLGNMHERARQMNGSLAVESSPDSGTVVTLTF